MPHGPRAPHGARRRAGCDRARDVGAHRGGGRRAAPAAGQRRREPDDGARPPRRRRPPGGARPRRPRRPRRAAPSTPRPAPSCSTRWPARPASRPSSTPSPATTGWRRRRTPAGRSPGGSTGSGPDRCGGCASTVATSGSPSPTCAPSSDAPRCRPPRPPPAPPSRSRPGGSPTVPPPTCRRPGPRRSSARRPRPVPTSATRSTRPSSAPRCSRGRRAGGASSAGSSWPSRPPPSAGLAWLVAYVVAGWLQLDRLLPEAPTVGVLPVPFLLLAGGLLLGPVLAALAAWLARIGARRRGAVMDARLRESIAAVADDHDPRARAPGPGAARGDPRGAAPRRRGLRPGAVVHRQPTGARVVHRPGRGPLCAGPTADEAGPGGPRAAGAGEEHDDVRDPRDGPGAPGRRPRREAGAHRTVHGLPGGPVRAAPRPWRTGSVDRLRAQLLRRLGLPGAGRERRPLAAQGPPGRRARQAARPPVPARRRLVRGHRRARRLRARSRPALGRHGLHPQRRPGAAAARGRAPAAAGSATPSATPTRCVGSAPGARAGPRRGGDRRVGAGADSGPLVRRPAEDAA